MEKPSEAAQSAGSLQPREPSPAGSPTSDQAKVETMPVLPSYPIPISATPWTLDRPSTRGLFSITVPIWLDAPTFLLNHTLLGSSVARSQMPLSYGQGLLVTGHGGTTPHAIGCRCHPQYWCSPQWPCANPLQPSGTQPPWVGFCGSGPMQNSFPRWDPHGSASAGGRIRAQGGRKILFAPLGAGSRRARWAPPHRRQDLGVHGMVQGSGYAPRKRNQDGHPWGTPETKRWSSGWPERQGSGAEETEPAKATGEDCGFEGSNSSPPGEDNSHLAKIAALPPSKDSSFYSDLENLFTDLPKKSSTVSDPHLKRQPPGDAAESGIRPPEEGGQHGQVSVKLDFDVELGLKLGRA
ncbi:uncharacterized protein LOC123354625 [Mauremys mutica]|uniref:uncharacterized protein LOC123354625 n=1 Tax=Mauremys mutica TaxID=74926 RepID=UPI001D161DEE|nr:uncharacterized protein LOC123354625 [Mauremys mutica]